MNTTVLLLYGLVTTALIGAAALLLERALSRAQRPTRWIWLGAMSLSGWLVLTAMLAPSPPPTPRTLVPFELEAGPLPGVSTTGPAVAATTPSEPFAGRAQGDALMSLLASRLPGLVLPRRWIAAAWAVSTLLVAGVLLAATLRMRRQALRWRGARLRGRSVRLSYSEGPATVGLIAPQIVLPRWMASMPADELELVLRHEEEHVRAGDTRLLAAGLLAVSFIPWNPLVWWQLRRLRHAVEVDCDRRVLASGAPPLRYGELLLRIGLYGRTSIIPAPALAGSRSSLERRLTAMRDAHIRLRPLPLVAALAGSLVLIVLACSGEPPTTSSTSGIAAEGRAGTEPLLSPEGDPLILLEADEGGTVRMNGEVQPVSTLAEALEPIATRETVVAVRVHPATPYHVVSSMTDQVRMAGLLRVMFAREAGEAAYSFVLPPFEPAPPPPARTPTEVDGVRVEVAARAAPPTPVPPRNLLNIHVLRSGVVRLERADAAGDGQLMRTEQLSRTLATQHAANSNTVAVLLAGADTPYRFVYEALGAIQQSPVTRYSIQMEEGDPQESEARRGSVLQPRMP